MAQVEALRHGTAMASLILHGGLDAGEMPLESPLYLRPILRPFGGDGDEFMADDELAVDLMHRVFVRMFEGEAGQAPTAPGVKIVNLSVGDRAQPFLHRMSSWARFIDWAAWKWNVLILISCGNHTDDIVLDLSYAEADRTPAQELARLLLSRIDADRRLRRLLSPSEAVNSDLVIGLPHQPRVAASRKTSTFEAQAARRLWQAADPRRYCTRSANLPWPRTQTPCPPTITRSW